LVPVTVGTGSTGITGIAIIIAGITGKSASDYSREGRAPYPVRALHFDHNLPSHRPRRPHLPRTLIGEKPTPDPWAFCPTVVIVFLLLIS
jgi:hypothetical protein